MCNMVKNRTKERCRFGLNILSMCFSDIDLSLKYIYIYHLNIDKIMEMMRFTIMYKCK